MVIVTIFKILLKETPIQVFSCEYREITRFFMEHL